MEASEIATRCSQSNCRVGMPLEHDVRDHDLDGRNSLAEFENSGLGLCQDADAQAGESN